MTNPTTFFNWQMPENTSLVTDLPADFEVFGQAVDTDLQDLLGGTTGQVLSKTSGTDLDFTWIDNDQGDITGVTAGTGISGGGTSGTVTVTNSMATAIDAKGDLIAGTADDTFSRLAIGANDTVLTADSSEATGLKWATPSSGGMTLITTTTFDNTAATYTYSSLGSYKHLMIVIDAVGMASASSIGSLVMQFNGVTTGAPYDSAARGGTGSYQEVNGSASNYMYFGYRSIANSGTSAGNRGYISGWIYDYAGATKKIYSSTSRCKNSGGDDNYCFTGSGMWNDTSAITSVTLFVESASNFATGTLKLYGVS